MKLQITISAFKDSGKEIYSRVLSTPVTWQNGERVSENATSVGRTCVKILTHDVLSVFRQNWPKAEEEE